MGMAHDRKSILLRSVDPRQFMLAAQIETTSVDSRCFMLDSMNSSNPPPSNPVLSAYENFVRDTPLVTRYVLTSQFVTWFVSFFLDLSPALSVIPHFTLIKFEIYRILLSPLVCSSFITLAFAYLSFIDNGRRLEFSMGSTHFAWLLLTIGIFTNTAFLILSFAMYLMSGNTLWLFSQSRGIWVILFGIIQIECSKAPSNSQRKLFFFTVPTIYYPLALFGLFSLIGGFQFSYLLSIGVGYLDGYGYLDRLKISSSRCKQWEDTILANFLSLEGWVCSNDARGTGSWNEEDDNTSGGGGFGVFSGIASLQQQRSHGEQQQQQGGSSSSDGASPSGVFPAGGGRALGSATRRPGQVDPRQARLQAIERNSDNASLNTSNNV